MNDVSLLSAAWQSVKGVYANFGNWFKWRFFIGLRIFGITILFYVAILAVFGAGMGLSFAGVPMVSLVILGVIAAIWGIYVLLKIIGFILYLQQTPQAVALAYQYEKVPDREFMKKLRAFGWKKGARVAWSYFGRVYFPFLFLILVFLANAIVQAERSINQFYFPAVSGQGSELAEMILMGLALVITVVAIPWAIYNSVRYCLVYLLFMSHPTPETVVVKDLFRQSANLLAGKWWRTAGTLIVSALPMTVLVLVLFIVGFLIGLSGDLSNPESMKEVMEGANALGSLVSWLAAAFIGSLPKAAKAGIFHALTKSPTAQTTQSVETPGSYTSTNFFPHVTNDTTNSADSSAQS